MFFFKLNFVLWWDIKDIDIVIDVRELYEF